MTDLEPTQDLPGTDSSRQCVIYASGQFPDRMQECRQAIHAYLHQTCDPQSPLLHIWEKSYIDGAVLVLPAQAATNIAEAHPRGYHNGVWHLATEYEAFCAQALLTNSNPLAPGHEQPKSFSAWPRRHDMNLIIVQAFFVQIFRKTCHRPRLQIVQHIWTLFRSGTIQSRTSRTSQVLLD